MKLNVFFVLLVLISSNAMTHAHEKSPIWYAEPAQDWKSAIPIGNGRIGGMIFGGIAEDQILLNENTIWCGPPVPLDNPQGPELIAQMRRLLYEGKYGEAESLCAQEFIEKKEKGDNRSYQPFGFLRLNHTGKGEPVNYLRSLDYEQAIATVSYEQDGVKFLREAFVSAPDQVLVMRISAGTPEQVSFSASFDRPFGATAHIPSDDCLHVSGQAYAADGKYQGVKFDGIIRFVADGGQTKKTATGIEVTKANSVTLYVAIHTDYNFDYANPLTHNRVKACEQQISAAINKGYSKLKADHVADFSTLYNRSSLDVDFPAGAASAITDPIDRRIAAVVGGAEDPELMLTYYRYCRYVFISASRKGNLPMNLQGVWNPLMVAPWRSNYHINVNFQEGYWFAEQSNLSECHEPLFTLTERLVINGKVTARKTLGTKRGFAAGHRTDAWFYTTPSDSNPCWGMYVIGGAWCAQQMMEHYRFTQDREFLKSRAFPVVREAALFFVDWLVQDPETGKLVSGPTTSAENSFTAPDGQYCSISMGNSQDQEMIWSTFRDYLEICRLLTINDAETREVKAAFDKLALPKIASDGRLMEWAEEYQEREPGHRHVSHLWGMMPGNRISLAETPELAQAVSHSLHYRLSHDYDAQGWSLGWITCLMARLKEGDRAFDLINRQYFGKAYPNLFIDAHGHVQVGDMMGTSLAIIELLIQSHTGTIELLPALPAKWKDGKVKGFCARGGFVFDFEWKDSKLTSASVYSRVGGTCNVGNKDKKIELSTESGKSYKISF
ncbi:MAG: glycoside hydrolase family 95 protein [Tannerellaceae bacterium]|nr:glycoside hydrolase family 95 protein [Tannerellaceae bacterium]